MLYKYFSGVRSNRGPTKLFRSNYRATALFILIGIFLAAMLVGFPVPSFAAPLADCPAFEITSKFTIAYGSTSFTSSPAPVGTVVTAKSPRGELVGCFVVSTAGKYGAMYIYGEDTAVTPALPGMRTGEQVTFYLDGSTALATPRLYWQNDRNLHLADLQTTGELAPIADFSALPTSGYAPLNVQFTDLSQGTITNWNWAFGDGTTSTLQNPSHSFTQPGRYAISLTVNGPGGADMRTRTDYIVVANGPPIADFSASPTSGTAPLTVTFANLSTNFSVSLWSFGDNSSSAETNPTHVYTQNGSYTVSLAVLGPGGMASQIKNYYITIYAPIQNSGRVQYWNNALGVPDTLLTMAGQQTYTAVTGLNGDYTISNIPVGNYTLAPSKSNAVNGISAYDASLVLRHAANLMTLSGPAALAADVNKSGSISSLDGSYIIRKSVNLIGVPFPGASKVWEFTPPLRAYTDLRISQTNQDFTAILLGDPSGNWTVPAGRSHLWQLQPQTPLVLTVQGGQADANGIVTATVQLDPTGAEVYSLDLSFSYSPEVALFQESKATALTANWLLETNPNPAGTIQVGLAGAQPIAGAGPILLLRFKLPDITKSTPLTPTASLNEGQIPVIVQGGMLGSPGWRLYLPLVKR